MPRFQHDQPTGVIPACLLPFFEDYAIDAQGYRKHLLDVAAVDGISAVTVNAHASEAAACSDDEQARVLDLTMDAIGDRLPVVNGIYADGSHHAARLARMAERGGAACLLVFPPNPMAMGGQLRGFKRTLYEGGLRNASFAWWPGVVPAGRVADEPWAFWDFLPTVAELSGARAGGEKLMGEVTVTLLHVDEVKADLLRELRRGDVVFDQAFDLVVAHQLCFVKRHE